jgi:hypothetical protein
VSMTRTTLSSPLRMSLMVHFFLDHVACAQDMLSPQ